MDDSFDESMMKEDKSLFSLTPVETVPTSTTTTRGSSNNVNSKISCGSNHMKGSNPLVTNIVVANVSDDEFGDFGFSSGSDSNPSSEDDEDEDELNGGSMLITPAPQYHIAETSRPLDLPSR